MLEDVTASRARCAAQAPAARLRELLGLIRWAGSQHGRNTVKPEYTGLQIQTAASTLPIPICLRAETSSPRNVILYQRLHRRAVDGRRQGRGRQGRPRRRKTGRRATPIRRTSSSAFAKGRSRRFGLVWKDRAIYYTPLALDMLIYNGTTPQSGVAYLGALSGAGSAYQGTAYRRAPPTTSSASAAAIGNHNFEIVGRARRDRRQRRSTPTRPRSSTTS